MDEFELIRSYFAPLAAAPGAAGLEDDVALVAPGLVATQDAMVEGVHFLSSDPLDTVARKLVRANVSDIICKGARPDAALLSLIWPAGRPVEEIGVFAKALGEDLTHWGAHLTGGDTTSTPGPLTLSLTLLGKTGARGPVRRAGAAAGDDVWVSGTIGDGWLGLQASSGAFAHLAEEDRAFLISKYRVPEPPPLAVADLVAEFASASIDISDGLAADAGHVANTSGVRITLRAADVPLSDPARTWLLDPGSDIRALLTGGDDYQTLFTAPSAHREAIGALGHAVSLIGEVAEGAGVEILGVSGDPLALDRRGWRHFGA